ncbi:MULTISPECIES: hypothetical protein [Methylobacterium]|uniref:Helix-turn-helix domain-containing protein n=1 Tax=Methylobacterium jeotgali TaxID=381630 RepID=A0ABQ4SX96_9HYPH|nr:MULTISPECIES: hypothetical protein [Methylobacterium]PIU07419.1 MAG: hypothetical protein COT56_04965 [Methylobacterium sp. CG09_land_8_20_14_0_10_71_15]PIU13955.1 MAG: hypothetical protein COT28_09430 [Methylobacterium sp. CG08_land_8_20_14_0_20_71_15]GBU17349.1 hypothetical protein AwMethylo_15640 [Methylobacterium sp.]GJE07722.1 hypothetical protein AOPFMNJM_3052 [Methylobacterium jeotgali]
MTSVAHHRDLRDAVEALVRGSGRSLAAIAAETGLPRTTVQRWSRKGRWRGRPGEPVPRKARAKPRPVLRTAAGDAPLDGAALRASLRRHVARQIARFDAALEDSDSLPDSARVLRDLGGLKRLLDELAACERAAEQSAKDHSARDDGDGAADAGDAFPDDLPALRAEIARRYAAFAGERTDAGLPGEPSGPAAAGDRS